MPINTKARRIAEHRKLDTKPKWLMNTKITTNDLQIQGLHLQLTLPKLLTQQTETKKFKKGLKEIYADRKKNEVKVQNRNHLKPSKSK